MIKNKSRCKRYVSFFEISSYSLQTSTSGEIDESSVSDKTEVLDVVSNWKTTSEEKQVHNSGESTVTQLGVAVAISQGDSPAPGPADLFAALVVVKVLYEAVTGANSHTVSEQVLEFAKPKYGEEAEHTKGTRPSTKTKHEKGQSRKGRDKGGEKGDARRTRYK